MEEDIKILEEFAHDLMQDYIYSKDEIPKSDIRLKDAIENLIARYKELEAENLSLTNSYFQVSREFEAKPKNFDYIPKSKIQEKIENYTIKSKHPLVNSQSRREYTFGIKALQELLD